MRWILLLLLLRYFCDADTDTDHTGFKAASIRREIRFEKFVDEVIAKGVTDLGFNVHKSAKKLNLSNDNYIVYSPVSIAAALYMTMLGAHGNTFTELSKILGLSWGLNIENDSEQIHNAFGALLRFLEQSATNGSLVKLANGLFVENDFSLRPLYKDVSSKIYQSNVVNLDFKSKPDHAMNYINNWTSEKTFGKIDKILQKSPSSDTKVVLVSSFYFKADWDIPFYSKATMQTFYPNGKSQPNRLQFPMMTNEAYYIYHNDSTLSCEIVGLSYEGYKYTMYFIIPHESNKEKLEHLESRLTYSEIKRLTSYAKLRKIILTIPKMKLTTDLKLRDILKDNGLSTLFDPLKSNLGLLINAGEKPDQQTILNSSKIEILSKISNNRTENSLDSVRNILNKEQNSASRGIFLNQVLHKVVVDVNEKGTEAAAVTALQHMTLSMPISSPPEVQANVPFLFFIQHETSNLILFWGSVVTPSPTT